MEELGQFCLWTGSLLSPPAVPLWRSYTEIISVWRLGDIPWANTLINVWRESLSWRPARTVAPAVFAHLYQSHPIIPENTTPEPIFKKRDELQRHKLFSYRDFDRSNQQVERWGYWHLKHFTDVKSPHPVLYLNRHPPTPSNQTAAHLHWLDELLVTLATGPGSCPAPLAWLKGCHFLIDSGLSLLLCSRFPIWQQLPLFGAKPYERREKGEHTLLSFKGNLKFKWTKQKVYLSPGVARCLVGLLILRRAILIDLV